MEAQRILKNVKEGKILSLAQDVKAYLNILKKSFEENVNTTDSIKYFTFMNRLLRSIGSFMHAKQVSTREEKENLADTAIFCIEIIKDYYFDTSVIKTVQLECSLYHIAVNLLHLKYYSQSVLCAEFLRDFLNISFDINLDNKDLLIIANNICISFWNCAMETEQIKDTNFKYYIGLQLRTVAATFLCFNSSEIQNLKTKISKTIMRYCTSKDYQPISEHLMKSLNTIWTYILLVHSKYKKELDEKQLLLFEILNTWSTCLIFYIQDKAVFDYILMWLQSIKNIKCESSQENNHITLVNTCVEVTSFCVQFFTLKKSMTVSEQMVKKWEKILKPYEENEGTEKTKMINSLCSFISFHLLEGFKVITAQNGETFLKNIVASEFLVKLCLDNFYEGEMSDTLVKHHSVSELVLAGGLLNVFLVITQQITDADTVLQLLNKARSFMEYVSSHKTTGMHKREFARVEDLMYYGMEVGNVGVVCFTKNLHDLAISFLKCSCNYLSMCLQREAFVKQHCKESLWKKQELLIHCYKLTECHNKALEIVMKALLIHEDKLKPAIELWVKIKREAQRSSKDSIVLKTIKDIVFEYEMTIDDNHMIMLLQHELKSYKRERHITWKASRSVLTQLLELSTDGINIALTLLESVQVSLTNENWAFSLDNNDRTPVEMCKEAIEIFEDYVFKNPNDNSYKLQLSVALFWMYQTKLIALQQIAKEEVEKSPVTPLENDTNERGPRGDEDDKSDQCDISPAFPHVTSQIELELLDILNRALVLWMEISKSTGGAESNWRKLLHIVDALDILDIIRTTAEVFAAAANDVNELRTWSIVQELAKETGNQVVELIAFGSMVILLTRLGYLNMAELVIDYVEHHVLLCNEDDNGFHMARLKFYLAKSDYLLQTEEYICGFQLLLTVLNDQLLERNTKSSIMLAAEAKLLSCYYCLLPPAAFKNNLAPVHVLCNETPITLALDSLKKSLSLIRHQKSSEGHKSVIDRDSPWCKPMLVRILLNSTLMVGKLYIDIGAPREARCYLQECLSVAQQFILTYWSGKILISLAHLDLLCDNLEDCHVKLVGLQYMFYVDHKSPTSISKFDTRAQQNFSCTNGDEQNTDEQNAEDSFLATRSGISLKRYIQQQFIDKNHIIHSSPLRKREKKVTHPPILEHLASCTCQLCEFHSLNYIHLEVAALHCQYLANNGYYKEAADELKQLLKVHDILNKKLKAENIFCLIKINLHYPDRVFQRVLHKVDAVLLFQITMQLAMVNTNQGNYQMGLYHMSSAMGYLKGASKCPEYFYSQLYGSFVYQKVVIFVKKLMASKEFQNSHLYGDIWLRSQTPLVSSVVSELSENLTKLNINSETPKSKRCVPDIHISSCTNLGISTKLCKAPVKREIFSSLMRNCVKALPSTPSESKGSSGAQPISFLFSSSDDDNAFLSPRTSIDFSPLKVGAEQKKSYKLSECVKNIKPTSELKMNVNAAKSFFKESISDENYNNVFGNQSNDQLFKKTQHSTPKSKHFLSVSNHVLQAQRSKDNIGSIKSNASENISKGLHLSRLNLNKENIDLTYQQAKKPLRNCKSTKQRNDTNESHLLPMNAPRRSRRIKEAISDINCVETERKGDGTDIFLCSPVSIQNDEKQPLVANNYQPHVGSVEQSVSFLKFCSPLEILRARNNNSKQKTVKKIGEKNTATNKETTHRHNIKSNRKRQAFKSTSEKDEAQNSITRSSISELLPTPILIETPFDQHCSSGFSDVEAVKLDFSNFPEIKLEDLVSELSYAVSLIQHHPPCPLYANMCLMLAILSSHNMKKKNFKENELKQHAAFFMSESVAVTLRHQAIICLSKIIRKFSLSDGSDVSDPSSKLPTNMDEEPNLLTISVVKKQALSFKNQETDCTISKRMKDLTNILPEEWTVVQVCAVPANLSISMSKHKPLTPELVVCQYRKVSSPNMALINHIDPEFTTNFLSEFETILRESSSTMTNKDAKVWWTLRRSLDARMKELSESMENSWLGCWKGLFLGLPSCQERMCQLQEAVAKIEVEAKQLGCSVADAGMIQVLLDSLKLLTAQQISTAVSHLWKLSVKDSAHYKLCKYVQSIASSFTNCDRYPVILILDKHIQNLPWESIPTLRNHPVTRIPSLMLLHAQLISYLHQPKSVLSQGIDSQQTFYIVNPGCDIPYTQEKFEAIFKQQKCWKGIVGQIPTSEEFISAFTDYKLFLYCGHGTGRIYLKGQSIEKLHCQAATVLMGCSSGRLKWLGHQLEPFGVVLQYWLGGSPCVVANLWDVTDKDIDRFTNSLLETWLPEFGIPSETGINVGQAVATARNVCKLPFLIGAAPVIYGLPVFVSK